MFYNLNKLEQISIIFMGYIQKVLASKRLVPFSHLTSRLYLPVLYFAITCGAKMIYFHTSLLYATNMLFIKTVF